MIDAEIDARLCNWARVYRDRAKTHTSMLARMIALYGDQEEGARAEEARDAAPVDERDAALVERALCSPLYPERYRLMLCVLYLRPDAPVGKLRRAMGLNRRRFEVEVRRATVMLSNVIEFMSRDALDKSRQKV